MSALVDAASVPMGIPIGGMDLNQPLAKMSDINSPWLLNVDCENQYLAVRPGVVVYATINTATTTIRALGVWGSSLNNDQLYAYIHDGDGTHNIVNVTTSTPSNAHTCADDDSTDEYPARFNGLLAFVTNTDSADCARTYNGSAWSAWGFTYSASPIGGLTVLNYRSRIYIFNGQKVYYGAVSAISGATTQVDFSDLFDTSSGVSWATSFPYSQGNINDTFFAFGCQNGETLVFSGSYPGSSTWGLIQKFKLDSGLGYNAILNFRNDTWIFTKTGIVSLRQILVGGITEMAEYSPSYPVNDYWTRLAKGLGASVWSGNETQFSSCHWPEKNRVLILAPGYLDQDGTFSSAGATIFSYNTLTKAWSIWRLTNILSSHVGGITYFNDGAYFYTGNVVMKIDPSVFKDETYNSASTYSAYPYQIDGAFTDLGTSGNKKRVLGFSPLLKTDFDGSNVTMKAVSDMGREVSDAAAIELQDGYNAGNYLAGARGNRIKYQILGNTDTTSEDGLRLYAMDAIVKPTQSVR